MRTLVQRWAPLGILMILAALAGSPAASAEVPWWNTSYQFRQKITIAAGSAAVPSGYTVSLTFSHASLVSASKSLASGNDVRVVYWNGSAWVELDRSLDELSSWNSASTKIWFRPQAAISASSSDGNYYLYYGNSGATSPPANKANIFDLWDDFNTGSDPPIGWTEWSDDSDSSPQAITSSVSGGILTIDSGGGLVGGVRHNTYTPGNSYGFVARARARSVGTPSDDLAPTCWFINAPTGQTYCYETRDASGNRNRYVRKLDSSQPDGNDVNIQTETSSGPFPVADTWYIYEVQRRPNGTMRALRNGSPQFLPGGGWSVADSAITSGSFGLGLESAAGQDYQFDWIWARKLVDPEPTTSLGGEESPGQPTPTLTPPPTSTPTATPAPVPLFGVFEQTFTQAGSYSNSYSQVSATATFTRPDGATRTIPLFWDGGTTWVMRFSPDVVGTWTWSISSNDAGLNGQTGSFQVAASTNKGGIRARSGFLYHFEYQDGTPFWWMGDTNWAAFGSDATENLNRSTVLHYFDVRASQGFNYIHSSLMNPGTNEGGPIFNSVSSETLNPAYFQEVDARIQYLNSKGITLGIVLAWANGNPSWESFSSDSARLRYARHVVARYSAYNVAFVVSGEWDETGTKAMYQAIGNEIMNNDPHDRLIGIHSRNTVEEFAVEAWMSFGDYQQLYDFLHANILVARDHSKPVVNAEYAYYLRDMDGDGIVDKPNSATLEEIRNATYDIAMAGGYFVTGFGTTYFGGVRDPGLFNPDDPKNDDWEEDVQHIRTLFTALEWWKVQPNDALLSGTGTRYAPAEIGQQYLAYVRGASGNLSLSLGGAPAATYSIRRFDPRTGVYTALADYSGTGPVTLPVPDSQDWVFVLQRIPGAPTPTPSSTPTPTSTLTPTPTPTPTPTSTPTPPTTPTSTPTSTVTPATATPTPTLSATTTPTPGAPVTVDFRPEADTYIYQVNPNTNYGRATSLALGGSPYRREIYIRFNVSGLPAGAVVTDARLILVASNGSTVTGGTIRKYAPSVEAWDERQPTWNNPLAGSDASGDLASLGPVSVGGTYIFSNLQSVVSGNGRVTFVIRSAAEDGAAYRSKEYGTVSQRPILRVTYRQG